MKRYFGYYENYEELLQGWGITADQVKDAEILFSSYGSECYSGEALVLFQRDGKLFEVNGSHCSCDGLEGQWEPEETTWAALAMREWSMWANQDTADAKAAMEYLVKEHAHA